MGAEEDEPGSAYDAIVIGTGFGGAVTAARLAQAGCRILVLERGLRYEGHDFPALPRNGQVLPDGARYVWSSAEGRYGLWDVRDLDGAYAVQAAGYGGGSLIYANVQLKPPSEVFATWPLCYRHDELDPYYALAARMLDARPIADSALFPLRKTRALQAAADHLGRKSQRFDPPLAVNFGPKGENAFGREQAPCVGCGECDSGCRHRAKNSLDFNYLAVAEDARDERGVPRAEIRTLAEAQRIERSADPEHPYRVHFLDHLVLEKHLAKAGAWRRCAKGAAPAADEVEGPRPRSARARYVFVCAGAVGSTELLFRSREALGLAERPIGRRFYTNSDALGVVFDAAHAQEPSVGPVITTGIAYRGDLPEDPWFLVQDGGYGAPVQAMVDAVFRSPGLLRRNRFRETLPEGVSSPGMRPGEPVGVRLNDLTGLPVRKNASMFEGIYRAEMQHQLTKMIPNQARRAFEELWRRAREEQVDRIDDLIEHMKPRMIAEITERFVRTLSCGDVAGCRPYLLPLVEPFARAAVRLGFWLIDFSLRGRPRLAALAADAFNEQHGLYDQRVAFMKALRFLTRYEAEPDPAVSASRTAALLTMGRDSRGHVLRWDAKKEELTATRIARSSVELASTQELALRELAAALGGELRTNPLWAEGRTPITVHGQGGCAMSDDDASVTDPNGEVRGAPGVFVMDASLFPSPVGVNPSATILALAERNLERFIREVLGKPDWHAPLPDALRARAPVELLPAAIRNTNATPGPRLEPIGIRFVERLFGFHIAITAPPFSTTKYSEFERCYLEGREQGHTLNLEVTIEIKDLTTFLQDPYRHRAEAYGTLTLAEHGAERGSSSNGARKPLTGLPAGRYEVRGRVDLLQPLADGDQRLFVYDLLFDHGGKGYGLRGHKRLRDDPGKDEWKDTTALFCVLRERRGSERSAGVVRVSADDFLFTETPSIEVTGLRNGAEQDNPALVLWALASFGEFFFGNLFQVYMREARWAQRLLTRSLQLGGTA